MSALSDVACRQQNVQTFELNREVLITQKIIRGYSTHGRTDNLRQASRANVQEERKLCWGEESIEE